MGDPACVQFLQWALPRLDLRWLGYRRVRKQVCKRLGRRLHALALGDLGDYRRYLDGHAEEWHVLEGLCRISISRFHRDRAVFAALADRILPALAAEAGCGGRDRLLVWSAGCAGGEEPYTLALAWRLAVAPRIPGVELTIVATDADPQAILRARRGCYRPSSLKELPLSWRAAAFEARGELLCLREDLRGPVELRCEDLRTTMPDGPFDLILCRNVVFTYFDAPLRERAALKMVGRLREGGVLVIGAHEELGQAAPALGLVPDPEAPAGIWIRRAPT